MADFIDDFAKSFVGEFRSSGARFQQQQQFDARQKALKDKADADRKVKERRLKVDEDKEKRLADEFDFEKTQADQKKARQTEIDTALGELVTGERPTTEAEKIGVGAVNTITGSMGGMQLEIPNAVPLTSEEITERLLKLDKKGLDEYEAIQEIINPEPNIKRVSSQRGKVNGKPVLEVIYKDEDSGEITTDLIPLSFDPKDDSDKEGKAKEKLRTAYGKISTSINSMVELQESFLNSLKPQIAKTDLEILDEGNPELIRQMLKTDFSDGDLSNPESFLKALESSGTSTKRPEVQYLLAKAKINQNREELINQIETRFFTDTTFEADEVIIWGDKKKADRQFEALIDKYVNQEKEVEDLSEKDLMGLALKYRNIYGERPEWRKIFLID